MVVYDGDPPELYDSEHAWVVTRDGDLHITREGVLVAVHARGNWLYVRDIPDGEG